MIIREKYLKAIRGFYDSDLIKVITGVRRCGKSVILETIMNEIKDKTTNIIYLNFEKTTDFNKASDATALVNYVKENRKKGKCYCFFDEIQELNDWQVAVKDLRLDNCSVFVTGSNSKLLSSEFLTLLSGRFVSFRIRPFVYKEIKEYSEFDILNLAIKWYDYSVKLFLGVSYPTYIYRYANKSEIYHSYKKLNSRELKNLKIYKNHIFGKDEIAYE